jgi:sugar/nucleoside kinase (ribokinase family)
MPEENKKARATKFYNTSGEPAANAAIRHAILGSEADLISPVGETIFGPYIINECLRYRVTIEDIGVGWRLTTIASIAITNSGQNRTIW